MKKTLLLITVIAAFAVCLCACNKVKPENEEEKPDVEETLDFTKVQLAGTEWKIDFYSYDLNGCSSMWRMGGDADLKTLVYKGAHISFDDKGMCNIVEDTQIHSPYHWVAEDGWLDIGWDTGYENGAYVEFSLSTDKKTVTMFWDSDVRGAYPVVTLKMSIEKDKLFK
ncbi:MAG: hypothetical protein IKX71_04930 [Bacteroidales bacterium]|nr:hypothetical protein [Bacteroidales bacterium]